MKKVGLFALLFSGVALGQWTGSVTYKGNTMISIHRSARYGCTKTTTWREGNTIHSEQIRIPCKKDSPEKIMAMRRVIQRDVERRNGDTRNGKHYSRFNFERWLQDHCKVKIEYVKVGYLYDDYAIKACQKESQ